MRLLRVFVCPRCGAVPRHVWIGEDMFKCDGCGKLWNSTDGEEQPPAIDGVAPRLAERIKKLERTRKHARTIGKVSNALKTTGSFIGLDPSVADNVVGLIASQFAPEAGAHFLAGVMHARIAQRMMDPERWFRRRSAQWFWDRALDDEESTDRNES